MALEGHLFTEQSIVEFERKMTDIKSLLESDGESAKEAGEITKDMEKQATELSGKYGISVQKSVMRMKP